MGEFVDLTEVGLKLNICQSEIRFLRTNEKLLRMLSKKLM